MTQFYAGFGRREISNDTVLSLNSTRSSGDILTPLKTTCVCLSDGETKILLFSNDVRNTTARIAADVKAMIEEKLGVPGGNIFIVATHNHSAPDVHPYDREDTHDWLVRIVYPGMLKAAEDAIADLSPCTGVFAGKATVPSVASVRRYFREDGTFAGIVIPKSSDSPIVRHETEGDPELRALKFAREGKKDVAVINFQVHAATAAGVVPLKVCADFLHALRETAEADGEVLVEYLQGGCGNINTLSQVPGENYVNKDYDLAGKKLAEGMKEAFANAREIPVGAIRVTNEIYDGLVNHAKTHLAPKVAEVGRAIREKGVTDAKEKNRMYVEAGFTSRYEASGIEKRSRYGKTLPVPLSSVTFGDAALTLTPFETFDQNSRQVREASPFPMTFTCGYTNAYMGYLPTAYGFLNGGYESLQSDFIPGTGEAVSLELLRQLHEAREAQ